MSTDVKIVKHYLKNGKISLFISYYPYLYNSRTGKVIKSENLHLFQFQKPSTPTEKKHNEDMEDLALAIYSKRVLQIRNEEYGFLDKTRRDEDFLAYFRENLQHHTKNTKWDGCYKHFERFCNGKCTFGMLTVDLCKRYSKYLQTQVRNRRTGELLHQNTAAGYLTTFRVILNKAYKDKMIEANLNEGFERIKELPTNRDYLTQEEFERLAATPCKYDVLKRASIFAVFSALRYSDIKTLEWDQIVKAPDGGWCIRKTIQKTGRPETIFISDEAMEWCGPRTSGYVFKRLNYNMCGKPFKVWIKAAGIEGKNITFHCLRHTAATMMCTNNVDLYTVSHMLNHKNIQTTQIYADVIDTRRRDASKTISLARDKEK